jgi:hypothetical protein
MHAPCARDPVRWLAVPDLPPTTSTVHFSDAAVSGYRDARERSESSDDAVRAELAQLAAVGNITTELPRFASGRIERPYYLTVGETLAFPLAHAEDGWVATTCWVEQPAPSPSRRARRERRRSVGRSRRSGR